MLGNTTFHFKNNFNSVSAKAYLEKIAEYDKKLNAPDQPTEFYCCDNFHGVLQLIGVDYKADYNGMSHNSLSVLENNTNLVLDGATTACIKCYHPT